MWSIKKKDESYELKPLPTFSTQFLKYNTMENNVEGICNVYLQHHPIKVNIKSYSDIVHHFLLTSFYYNPKLMGG